MAFDLDAYRAAHELWTFTANRRAYVSRPVSAEHMLTYQRKIAGATPERQLLALRWLFRQAFPWRPSFMWRGDPVQILMRGTRPGERDQILADFFVSLAGSPPLQRENPTNGTDSPP